MQNNSTFWHEHKQRSSDLTHLFTFATALRESACTIALCFKPLDG